MIPVLVPRRSDGARRDASWAFLRSNYWANLSDYHVIEGTQEEGSFNRSLAINTAARDAGDWDIAVVADSDSWVDPAQLSEAVTVARGNGKLVIAHSGWCSLTEECTKSILAGNDPEKAYQLSGRDSVSGVLVVPRSLWDAVGGYDPGFVGWGWEDSAFARACILARGMSRITGPCWHLNHERVPPSRSNPEYLAGEHRYSRYVRASSLADVRRINRAFRARTAS